MENSIYETPKSQLESAEKKVLSASERLAESRREMEESSALETLKMIWGFRFVIDIVYGVAMLYFLYIMYLMGEYSGMMVAGFLLLFCLAEMVAIVAFFRRKRWCVIPLHIFAGFSLLSFPIGTILSVIHYFNMHKVRFDK